MYFTFDFSCRMQEKALMGVPGLLKLGALDCVKDFYSREFGIKSAEKVNSSKLSLTNVSVQPNISVPFLQASDKNVMSKTDIINIIQQSPLENLNMSEINKILSLNVLKKNEHEPYHKSNALLLQKVDMLSSRLSEIESRIHDHVVIPTVSTSVTEEIIVNNMSTVVDNITDPSDSENNVIAVSYTHLRAHET